MASAAALAAAHSVPPVYSIPIGPRIRPPRLLPGTKAANTNPQPDGPVPETTFAGGKRTHDNVWVQGKWRHPQSNAARDRRQVQSKQIEKALNHITHGMNIYAYRHIRTNQVVYSLTRVMQNSKVLKQLLFHGKQTVPAALRRDLWRPHFSVHFDETPAGAQAGLQAYRLLRELATRRQLSPSEGSLIATQEDVDKARARYDPANLADMEENERKEIRGFPRLGQILPPKYRAKKLMDQKISSVADLSFVLKQLNDAKLSPVEKKLVNEQRLIDKQKAQSQGNKRRLSHIRSAQAAKELQIDARQQLVEPKPGQLGLDAHAAERIALEHGGVLVGNDRVADLQDIAAAKQYDGRNDANNSDLLESLIGPPPPTFRRGKFVVDYVKRWKEEHGNDGSQGPPSEELQKQVQEAEHLHAETHKTAEYESRKAEALQDIKSKRQERGKESRGVQVLWSDLRDGTYAETWSDNVYHGWLDAKAVIRRQLNVVRQEAGTDEDGVDISEQRQTRHVQVLSSPHVMGREGLYRTPSDLAGDRALQTQHRDDAWKGGLKENVVREMIFLRSQAEKDVDEDSLAKLDGMEARYPSYAESLQEMDDCAELIASVSELRQKINRLDSMSDREFEILDEGVYGSTRDAELKGLKNEIDRLENEVRSDYDSKYRGFSDLERRRQGFPMESEMNEIDRERYEELSAEIELLKVDLTLEAHQQKLRDNGDGAYNAAVSQTPKGGDSGSAASSDKGERTIDHAALKELGAEADESYSRPSLWQRVKGSLGGRR